MKVRALFIALDWIRKNAEKFHLIVSKEYPSQLSLSQARPFAQVQKEDHMHVPTAKPHGKNLFFDNLHSHICNMTNAFALSYISPVFITQPRYPTHHKEKLLEHRFGGDLGKSVGAELLESCKIKCNKIGKTRPKPCER